MTRYCFYTTPQETEAIDISQVSRDWLHGRVKSYGFIEIDCVLRFLQYVCEPMPDESAILYISSKVTECLKTHDNGGRYFTPLKEFNVILNAWLIDKRIYLYCENQ
ncbi:Uncharacterised protein [Serratia ficaria]|nr:Uncharacterised protein [Serratia ficaria]CAI1540773.1 Uncharacterised protein [Serratia ficaria]CAI1890644.1 Uncharacterised protein [Serratia ficaria]CAI2534516.1 Uncharacterised protein [Serratia ficaria]CAI2538390.1 Uncharacterised protein [Serratia ficaria]